MIGETGASKDWVLRVGVTDGDWSSIHLGQKAAIRLDAFAGKTFTGVVYRKSRAADQARGSFQEDIQINLERKTPAAGMFGRAGLVPDKEKTKNPIPTETLTRLIANQT